MELPEIVTQIKNGLDVVSSETELKYLLGLALLRLGGPLEGQLSDKNMFEVLRFNEDRVVT